MILNAKQKQINEILGNSAYLPSSGAYKGAEKALQSLTDDAVGQLWAVIITKRKEVIRHPLAD